MWRLGPQWISHQTEVKQTPNVIQDYWHIREAFTSFSDLVWDAFKEFMWGHYIVSPYRKPSYLISRTTSPLENFDLLMSTARDLQLRMAEITRTDIQTYTSIGKNSLNRGAKMLSSWLCFPKILDSLQLYQNFNPLKALYLLPKEDISHEFSHYYAKLYASSLSPNLDSSEITALFSLGWLSDLEMHPIST